jgi:hypothetical protein
VGAGVKTTRHPKRKESGGGKQQTLFPMKSKSKDAEVEAEVDETMIETPTEEMDVEVESEELQEAQAPSIVGDSLVCPSSSSVSYFLLTLPHPMSSSSAKPLLRPMTRLSGVIADQQEREASPEWDETQDDVEL